MLADDSQRLDALMPAQAEAAKAVHAAEVERHAALTRVTEALEAMETLQASVEPKVRASADWLAQKGAVDRVAAVWTPGL